MRLRKITGCYNHQYVAPDLEGRTERRSAELIESGDNLLGRHLGVAPMQTKFVFAKKSLTGSWTLYAVTHRPKMPVGHMNHKPGPIAALFGVRPYSALVSDPRWGRPEKIISGLSLQEAFDRVRSHEIDAKPGCLTSSSGVSDVIKRLTGNEEGRLVLEQSAPTQDPTYWRNLPQFSTK